MNKHYLNWVSKFNSLADNAGLPTLLNSDIHLLSLYEDDYTVDQAFSFYVESIDENK
jgi:hypothetical protein